MPEHSWFIGSFREGWDAFVRPKSPWGLLLKWTQLVHVTTFHRDGDRKRGHHVFSVKTNTANTKPVQFPSSRVLLWQRDWARRRVQRGPRVRASQQTSACGLRWTRCPANARTQRRAARTHADVSFGARSSGGDCTPAELLPDCPKRLLSNHKIPKWGDGGLVWPGGRVTPVWWGGWG